MGADLHAVVITRITIFQITYVDLDSPPIQLIRVLCRQFDEAVHHLYHSAVSNDTQSSSQASSNLSSTPLEDVYLLNNNNLDINTTFTSTNPDDIIRKSSSNVDCQKQSEHFSKKVVKKKALTCDSDDDSQDGINSLVDANINVGTRQKTKRKCRY
ncbi:unnamed protein product [Rotaria sp. Silwood2]|nr:unnamed protein product [Rotaria sp. Silwood2]